MNIFFFVNWEKEGVLPVVQSWIKAAANMGFEPFLAGREAEHLSGTPEYQMVRFVSQPEAGHTDFVLTFGGDGTMICALDRYARLNCPFLGVNMGRMGFLLEADAGRPEDALDALLHNRFFIEKRMMLALTAEDGSCRALAMNEVSVSRGMSQRMIAMDVICDSRTIEHYIADGVILSTPTGSTAYSLAAGGPIIMPDVECILVNPICPHTLTSRPIILSKEKTVEVWLNMKEERKGSILSVDGETVCSLSNGDRIEVSRAECSAQLVRLRSESNFFELMKNKLSIQTL
ncbi:MAG: NAD(+)/NADH kinase [Clostridia bacterium]|nr:NAD(+)/NADH kinase [Clostridia bacterium]